MLKKVHNAKGFTLIELMIVIAIIGILAAIAIPMYRAQTCKAKLTEVTNAMSHVGTSISNYYNETGNVPNSITTWDGILSSLGVQAKVGRIDQNDGGLTWTRDTATPSSGALAGHLVAKINIPSCGAINNKTIALIAKYGSQTSDFTLDWNWDANRSYSTIPATYMPKR